jgi:hypothetical protein
MRNLKLKTSRIALWWGLYVPLGTPLIYFYEKL